MMFVGSFAVQWGIGVVVDLARASRGVDTAAGLRVAFAVVLARLRRDARCGSCAAGSGSRGRTAAVVTARRPSTMHLHILGICGTFMGGLAAIAQAAATR